MSWVRVPAQAFQGGYAQHYTFYASRDQQDGQVGTWTFCKHLRTLNARGIQLNRRTLHVLQLFGCPPDHSPRMVNEIGPNTRLWVFVKGEPGKIFSPFAAIGPPGLDLIIPGALLQYTAQV